MSNVCSKCGYSILIEALVNRLNDQRNNIVSNFDIQGGPNHFSELLDSILKHEIQASNQLRINDIAEKCSVSYIVLEVLYKWTTWQHKTLLLENDCYYMKNGLPETHEDMSSSIDFINFFSDLLVLYASTDNNFRLSFGGDKNVNGKDKLYIEGYRAKKMIESILIHNFGLPQSMLLHPNELQSIIPSLREIVKKDYYENFKVLKIKLIQSLHHYLTKHIGINNYANLIAELFSITGVENTNSSNIRQIVRRHPLKTIDPSIE